MIDAYDFIAAGVWVIVSHFIFPRWTFTDRVITFLAFLIGCLLASLLFGSL